MLAVYTVSVRYFFFLNGILGVFDLSIMIKFLQDKKEKATK